MNPSAQKSHTRMLVPRLRRTLTRSLDCQRRRTWCSSCANFLYGPAHRWFGIYFLLVFATGIYTLWRTSNHASERRESNRSTCSSAFLLPAAGYHDEPHHPGHLEVLPSTLLGPYFSLLFFSSATCHYPPPSRTSGYSSGRALSMLPRSSHPADLRSRRSTYRSRRRLPAW